MSMNKAYLKFYPDAALTKKTQGRVTGVWAYWVHTQTEPRVFTGVFHDGTGGRADRIPDGLDPADVDVEALQYAAEKAQGRNPDALAGARAFLAGLGIEAP